MKKLIFRPHSWNIAIMERIIRSVCSRRPFRASSTVQLHTLLISYVFKSGLNRRLICFPSPAGRVFRCFSSWATDKNQSCDPDVWNFCSCPWIIWGAKIMKAVYLLSSVFPLCFLSHCERLFLILRSRAVPQGVQYGSSDDVTVVTSLWCHFCHISTQYSTCMCEREDVFKNYMFLSSRHPRFYVVTKLHFFNLCVLDRWSPSSVHAQFTSLWRFCPNLCLLIVMLELLKQTAAVASLTVCCSSH